MSGGEVILIEDDGALRAAMVQALELTGLSVTAYDNAARALRRLTASFSGCIVSDIRMEGMDGLQLFARVRALDPDIPFVLITGHGDIAMAVRAMRDGAFDFLAKPFSTDHLAVVVARALQTRRLVMDNRALRRALEQPQGDLVAQSRVMLDLRNAVAQVAQTTLDVVIEGEAGSGKEVWARQIHVQSRRYAGPFVVMPCQGLDDASGLAGWAESAGGGSWLLDGCEALSAECQTQLVTLLDMRDRARAAGHGDMDFRLIAAIRCSASESGLQQDLLHRLGPVRLRVPPLRDRREDIATLFAGFVREALEQTGRRRFEMSAADRKRLLEHDWPGNIRELRNYAFGAVLNLPRQALTAGGERTSAALATRVAQFERMVIAEALTATGGNVVRASAMLGTSRKSLYERLARHRLDPADFRSARI